MMLEGQKKTAKISKIRIEEKKKKTKYKETFKRKDPKKDSSRQVLLYKWQKLIKRYW